MAHDLFASSRVVVRHARNLTCPRCRSPVFRVPRRLVDRLVGLFQPTRRYACRSLVCSWEGNLDRPPGIRYDQDYAETSTSLRRRFESTDAR